MFRFMQQILKCPCGGELSVEVFDEVYNEHRNEKEITEGILVCKKTNEIYPIIDAVPRMLPGAPEPRFLYKYRKEIGSYRSIGELKNVKGGIKNSAFDFEWKVWGAADRIYGMDKEEYKAHLLHRLPSKNKEDPFFKEKTVLEVGSGHGMCAEIFSPLCKEYIGVDLSIKSARFRTRNLPNVSLVQANILKMPFKDNIAEYVFSNGVIHHTPDPYRAFCNTARLTKPNGELMIWVYPKGNFLWETTNKTARFFTTRLPTKVLYYFSYLLIPALMVFKPYGGNRIGKNTPKELVQTIYDWLSPSYQSHHTENEIADWFRINRYAQVEVTKIKAGATGIKMVS